MSATPIHLLYVHDGIGMAPDRAAGASGLGQRIVTAMASKLGVEVTRDAVHEGTRMLIRFPLPQPRAG